MSSQFILSFHLFFLSKKRFYTFRLGFSRREQHCCELHVPNFLSVITMETSHIVLRHEYSFLFHTISASQPLVICFTLDLFSFPFCFCYLFLFSEYLLQPTVPLPPWLLSQVLHALSYIIITQTRTCKEGKGSTF